MNVLVLSDTHLRPGGGRRLPDAVYDALADADAVLHAGDIVTADLLHELGGFGAEPIGEATNEHSAVFRQPRAAETSLPANSGRTNPRKSLTPVHAVLGNNDLDPALAHLPEQRLVVLDGVRVGMVHDSGHRDGRERRMRHRFPDADVVVFGHSHIPWNQPGLDGQLLFNPGSPTERRTQPVCTYGVLHLVAGRVERAEVVPVSSPFFVP